MAMNYTTRTYWSMTLFLMSFYTFSKSRSGTRDIWEVRALTLKLKSRIAHKIYHYWVYLISRLMFRNKPIEIQCSLVLTDRSGWKIRHPLYIFRFTNTPELNKKNSF